MGGFVDALADSFDSDTDFDTDSDTDSDTDTDTDECFSSGWGKGSLALRPVIARLAQRGRRLAR